MADGAVIVGLLLALVLGSPSRVFVAEGEHASALSEALAKEPDLIVGTATSAELAISLNSTPSALMLVMREPSGAAVLERRIELDRGFDPALRMAVLLIRGALEPAPVEETAAPIETVTSIATTPREEEATLAMDLSAAFVVLGLPKVDPGVAGALHFGFDRFRIGVAAAYSAGTITERESNAIDGRISELFLLADGSATLVDVDPFAFDVFVSGGFDRVQARFGGRTPLFGSPGTQTDFGKNLPVVLGGAGGTFRLGGAFLAEVRLGLRWLPAGFEVGLPVAFVAANPVGVKVRPLKSNPFAGFLSIGLTYEIF